MMRTALVLAGLAATTLSVAPVAKADRAEPVPLYGSYDTFLDHSRQTFEGPPGTIPFTATTVVR